MNILIIGSKGQVGASLVQQAEENKILYSATDRTILDVTNEAAIQAYFEKNNVFDFVINATAYTNVDGAEDDETTANAVNHFGVHYLALACKHYNIPLIHISTDYVFDGEKLTDYSEDDFPNPQNVYGQSKLAGEIALQSIWEKHIILRVSWVFSEFGKNFVKTIANLCDQKEKLGVIANQYGSPTSARSIAKVLIEICRNNNNAWGVYHYSDFPATNWHQLATHVARIKGKDTKIDAIEEKDYPLRAKRPKNSRFCNHKIKKVFGIEQGFWMAEVERILPTH
ncbi:MAG: dTDP-4-dehydrorhamnose reductase [Coxiellaceae bacterium]|nr:dTDP-4-dehydrorhamnose reductase [Coxiellaceae bacterium]